jgi:hypothetical protein
MSDQEAEERIQELEERVRELERVVNRDLGYSLGRIDPPEPSSIDCDCGTTFEINLENGLICPDCGRGSDERGEST